MQVPLSPLPRTTLIDVLAARLEEEILSGRLTVGAKLPSEGALSSTFGVSRPVVREALARLRERGLVETLNGSGTYVRRPVAAQLTEAFVRHVRGAAEPGAQLEQLYEARLAIELTVVRLAAERAGAEDVAALERRLAEMRTAGGDGTVWAEADLGFHLALADATGNAYFRTLLTPLAMAIVVGMAVSRRSAASVRAGLAAHDEILDRIRAHDPDGAVEAMRRHLEDSRERYADALADEAGDS